MESLLNLLKGDRYDKVQLERVQVTRRNSSAESRLYGEISQLVYYGLDSFYRQLNEWLQDTTTGNSSNMWVLYKLEQIDNKVEVWHLNAEGNKDRLVCYVYDKTLLQTDDSFPDYAY